MLKYGLRVRTMKKKLTIIAVIIAAISVQIAPGFVKAQSEPAPAAPGSSFEQRLAQRKNERKVSLDEQEQKRLVGQCTRAQTELRKVQTDTRHLASRRTDTYRSIDAKLWVAVGKLKLGGVDTFKLERHRASYIQNVDTFHALMQEYRQVLDDSVVINCGADPAGFKALLETARLYHKQLTSQSATIRNLIVNDIKGTLTEHSVELQPKSAGEN